MNDISIEEALKIKDRLFVDVRSPGEYNEASIPGSVNLPLLGDEERAKVGKLYRHNGPEEARELGLEFVSPKIPLLMNRIKQLSTQYKVIIFCWRGGQRSKAVCNLANIMELSVLRLSGGYKAYRRYVNDFLSGPDIPGYSVVLHGLTGVGKTQILDMLAEKNVGVVDLEGMANNRGSVFGAIGLGQQPSQKMFEARIVEVLTSPQCATAFAIECESKRIGRLSVPDLVVKAMAEGSHILLYSSMEKRIKRLVEMYAGVAENTEGLYKAIDSLTKRLGKIKTEQLKEQVSQGDFASVVEYLLINYYDPLYSYPQEPSNQYPLSVCTDQPDIAAETITKFMQHLTCRIKV
jgi:tRNA 2-selenouridine synthase